MRVVGLPTIPNAKYRRILIEYRAKDSINMVVTALYNLFASVGAPKAFQILPLGRMSCPTIMSMRRILSEEPIENSGMMRVEEVDIETWWMQQILIAG